MISSKNVGKVCLLRPRHSRTGSRLCRNHIQARHCARIRGPSDLKSSLEFISIAEAKRWISSCLIKWPGGDIAGAQEMAPTGDHEP